MSVFLFLHIQICWCKWLLHKCSCTTRLRHWHSVVLSLTRTHARSASTRSHQPLIDNILVGLWRVHKDSFFFSFLNIYDVFHTDPSTKKDYGNIAKTTMQSDFDLESLSIFTMTSPPLSSNTTAHVHLLKFLQKTRDLLGQGDDFRSLASGRSTRRPEHTLATMA